MPHQINTLLARYSTPICHLCGLTIGSHADNITIWCDDCLDIFHSSPRCQRCGLITEQPETLCGACLANPPPWNNLYCVGSYTLPLSRYIYKLKYKNEIQYCYDLTYLLMQRISNPAPLIVSMPLHWRRFFLRGYNQSTLLGYCLAEHFNQRQAGATSLEEKMFKRIKSTPSQQGLNRQQRVRNLRRAFALNYHPNHTHIAIIDDVVTTGSSVRQLCNLLFDVGVEKIDIYCICRTEV